MHLKSACLSHMVSRNWSVASCAVATFELSCCNPPPQIGTVNSLHSIACGWPLKQFECAGTAAFLELCCGPLYILAKVQLADGVVAVAEAAAIIAKGSLTLFLLKAGNLPVPIALSWAQVRNSPTLLLVIWIRVLYGLQLCARWLLLSVFVVTHKMQQGIQLLLVLMAACNTLYNASHFQS